MPHLNPEDLARLVDESPTPAEAGHLGTCAACTESLAELRRQTAALAALPPLEAPAGEWKAIEARLNAEGLVRRPAARSPLLGGGVRATWATAAALAAFLRGGAGGFALRGPAEGAIAGNVPRVTTEPPPDLATPVSLEDAEGQVKVAESRYLAALDQYNELRGPAASSGAEPWAARLAALESIVASTRAALAEAPYDPVINGYYINATAQRNAMFRQVSTEDTEGYF
jgi:hypothetical protein